jgi:hypothetical protein
MGFSERPEVKGPRLCEGTAHYFWQTWLPTVQDVLQADWQEAWHSPQPPVWTVFCSKPLFTVTICFAIEIPPLPKDMRSLNI